MKLYATKANARRAARTRIADVSKPIEGKHYTIEEKDGKFGWRRVQQAPKAPAPEAQAKLPEPPKVKADKPKAKRLTKEEEAHLFGTDKKVFVETQPKPARRKGAVREVWDICEECKGWKRKDVIQYCVDQGINFYTARTQYQAWKQASDNSK